MYADVKSKYPLGTWVAKAWHFFPILPPWKSRCIPQLRQVWSLGPGYSAAMRNLVLHIPR